MHLLPHRIILRAKKQATLNFQWKQYVETSILTSQLELSVHASLYWIRRRLNKIFQTMNYKLSLLIFSIDWLCVMSGLGWVETKHFQDSSVWDRSETGPSQWETASSHAEIVGHWHHSQILKTLRKTFDNCRGLAICMERKLYHKNMIWNNFWYFMSSCRWTFRFALVYIS